MLEEFFRTNNDFLIRLLSTADICHQRRMYIRFTIFKLVNNFPQVTQKILYCLSGVFKSITEIVHWFKISNTLS